MLREKRTFSSLFLCLLFWSDVLCSSKIKMESDGGYSGIVVKISDEVPEDKCPEILANIKKLLEESSHTLYDALDHRAYFRSAVVVVPTAWRDGKCQQAIAPPKSQTPYRVPDILVVPSNEGDPLQGPLAQQSRGCGQPGEVIRVPQGFLEAWNMTWANFGDPAKLFVHEWAKFRYGIFDEMGYPGDPLYPNFFLHDGKVVPTGTSNVAVQGVWTDNAGKPNCNPARFDCNFRPFPGGNDGVTCSLGYLPYLPTVTTYCGNRGGENNNNNSPNPMGPTKHNVLCSGRSALEVIYSHADFVNRHAAMQDDKKGSNSNLKPTLTLVRDPAPQFVLVMETSSGLDSHGQWKWINKAAQKFIRYDLPVNSNLAIVTFGNSSQIQHPMTQVHNDAARARLADTIPDRYHLSRGSSGGSTSMQCLLCGVQKAVHDVLRSNLAGAHLVLVTRGTEDTLSISDEQTIEEYVKYYHIKISTILIPDGQKFPLAFYDSIAQMSGGVSTVIENVGERSVKTYLDLMGAFANLLEADDDDDEGTGVSPLRRVVHQGLVEVDGFSASSGKFNVDNSLGMNTKFGVYVDNVEDHLIRSVSFTDSLGHVYGPYTSMSSLYDVINLKVINFPVASSPPFDEADQLGTPWQYTIDWYTPAGDSGTANQQLNHRSAVVITSEARTRSQDFVLEVWTNSDLASDIVTAQHPLTVFARLTRGGRGAVFDAKVEVTVAVAGNNGTLEVQTVRLVDNGNGDPDLQSGDGIYSRHLTRYISAGRYAITATADDNNNKAYTAKNNNNDNKEKRHKRAMPLAARTATSSQQQPPGTLTPCCGSRVLVPETQRQLTGEFQRTRKGPVIHLISVPSANDADLTPPSRIADLKLDQVENNQSNLLATWTPPGDDYDVGRPTGYKVLYARSVAAYLDPESNKDLQTLLEFQLPEKKEEEGSPLPSSFQFAFDHHNEDFYLALLAVDERGNEGKPSNLVRVFLSSSSNNPSDQPQQNPVSATKQGQGEGVMIGVLCGTFLVIALMLWAGIWYLRNKHRRNGSSSSTTKNGGVNATLVSAGGGNNNLDTSGSDVEIKTPPTRLRVPQFSSLASGGAVGSFPTSSSTKDYSTPTYWSASQLLEEHEQRKMAETLYSATTYHNNHPVPLDPIVEDPEETYGINQMWGATMTTTSTPIKYNSNNNNGTFPRRVHSVSPSPSSSGVSPRPMGGGEVTYGYAQSEPPTSNGLLYGTLRPRGSSQGHLVPPQIPPKPSLSALLGLSGGGSNGDVMEDLLTGGEINSGGRAVRSISHV